jgi:hypothetical protein
MLTVCFPIDVYHITKYFTSLGIFILGKEFLFQSFCPVIKTQRFRIKQSLGRFGVGA